MGFLLQLEGLFEGLILGLEFHYPLLHIFFTLFGGWLRLFLQHVAMLLKFRQVLFGQNGLILGLVGLLSQIYQQSLDLHILNTLICLGFDFFVGCVEPGAFTWSSMFGLSCQLLQVLLACRLEDFACKVLLVDEFDHILDDFVAVSHVGLDLSVHLVAFLHFGHISSHDILEFLYGVFEN